MTTKRLGDDVLSVISACEISGHSVRINGQLDRKLYERVNEALESLGGKWSRKLKAHDFSEDPRSAIDGLLLSGEITRARDVLGFFPTPPELVARLFEPFSASSSATVLEPSAGNGAIVEAAVARGCSVVALEIDEKRAAGLAAKYGPGTGVRVERADFMAWDTELRFDWVVMNPPFAQQQDIDHVARAYRLLKPGGKLAAIMSASVMFRDNSKSRAFRDLLQGQARGEVEQIEDGAFRSSGTSVRTVLVRMQG